MTLRRARRSAGCGHPNFARSSLRQPGRKPRLLFIYLFVVRARRSPSCPRPVNAPRTRGVGRGGSFPTLVGALCPRKVFGDLGSRRGWMEGWGAGGVSSDLWDPDSEVRWNRFHALRHGSVFFWSEGLLLQARK